MELTQHPLSAAFPAMDDADFILLKDDIEYHGQREPIIVLDGMVLDGWHRYRACLDLGIEPTQFRFGGNDPVAFVRSQNLHRRHLTAAQRVAAIAACFAWRPPGRPIKPAATAYLPTQDDIAKMAGAKVRTVRDVQAAQKVGLLEPIRDGALTAEEAAKIARGTPTKPKAKPEVKREEFGPDAAELAANAAEEFAYRESMEKVIESDDKLKAAAEEIKRLTALVKVLESRNAGLMNEKNEAIRMAKSWQRKFEQASKVAA